MKLKRREIPLGRKLLRASPFFLTVVIIILCLVFLRQHDFDELLSLTPDNFLLAFAVLMGFYALKSLSVVFPLTALFIAAGAIYPFWLASIVSLMGLAVCYTIPYLVGRFSGGYFIELILSRYPKAQKLVSYTHENDLLTSFVTRAVVFVPGDVVSMLHGALKMPYKPYLAGSLVGTLPQMLIQVYLGANLTSMSFKTVIVFILLTGATLLLTVPINNRFGKGAVKDDQELFYQFDLFEEWQDGDYFDGDGE